MSHILETLNAINSLAPRNRFLLILIPSGPSAMLLANVAEMVNVDQGPIARYLTISVGCTIVADGCCAHLCCLLVPRLAHHSDSMCAWAHGCGKYFILKDSWDCKH